MSDDNEEYNFRTDKPYSKDGIVLEVGMPVIHFLCDTWDDARPILSIQQEKRGHFEVIYRSEYGDITHYWPHLLIASEAGFKKQRIVQLEASIKRAQEEIVEWSKELGELKCEAFQRSDSGG